MNHSPLRPIVAILLLAGLLCCRNGTALALGVGTPLGFQGNGSRIIDTGTPGNILPVTVVQEETVASANRASSVYHHQDPARNGAAVHGWANSGDYRFSGRISSEGTATPWRAGGYFYDELYYESAANPAAELEFIFDVHAAAELYGSTPGRADLTMSWVFWDGVAYHQLSLAPILSLSGIGGSQRFGGTLILSSTDADPAHLLTSGTYLPFGIGLWGDAANGRLSWEDPIRLTAVRVRSPNGDLLDPDSFTLRSANSSRTFAPFENPPGPVPLPPAFLLLAAGSAGLLLIPRRRFDH